MYTHSMSLARFIGICSAICSLTLATHSDQPFMQKLLSLDDCLKIGIERNSTLQIMEINLASSLADIQIASSIYDSRLQLNGTWQDSELPPGSFPSDGGVERGQFGGRLYRGLPIGVQVGLEVDVQRNLFEGMGFPANPAWRTAVGITLKVPVWKNAFGATDRAFIESFRRRQLSRQFEFARSRELVGAQIVQQYWNAAAARKVAESQGLLVERLSLLLDDNRKKAEEGLLDESAVLAVDAALALAEVDRVTLLNDVAFQDEKLKDLINIPARDWDVVFIDYGFEPSLPGISHDLGFMDVYEQALRDRADLEAIKSEIARLDTLIRMRRLDNRADVELSGSIGRGDSDTRWNETLDFDKNLWSLGVAVDLSLDRSDTAGRLAQAYLEREALRVEMESLERTIALECRSSVREVDISRRLLHATRRALDAQERKLALETQRFDRGQSAIQVLIDYENDRDLAARDHQRAWTTYKQAEALLRLALGEGLRMGGSP